MALRTRAAVDALVAEFIDDPSNQRWSAANLKAVISMVYDQMWGEILEVAPELLQATDTITTLTSPGYIDTSEGGDLTYRLFRVHEIFRDGVSYDHVDGHKVLVDWANGDVQYAEDYKYFFVGQNLYLTPFDLTTDLDITYSYLPAEYEDLADATAINWPEGHDMALITAAATFLMLKGGAEDPQFMYAMADKTKKDMFSAIKRRRTGSLYIRGASSYSNFAFGGIY